MKVFCSTVLVTLLLGVLTAFAPIPAPSDATANTINLLHSLPTVMKTVSCDRDKLSFHDSGVCSLVGMSAEGELLIAVADNMNPEPVTQGQEPVPHLTTSWTDVAGVTHTVSTPIASTTPAGLAKATQLHQTLVDLMQRNYPPRPPQ